MIHLVADWLLQTEWMVVNKSNVTHMAAWVHSGIHALGLLLVFPWYLAFVIGIAHLLIDTRVPVNWWMTTVKGVPKSSPTYIQVELWLDQVFHLTVLAVVVLFFTL
jgi:hypothetical protein